MKKILYLSIAVIMALFACKSRTKSNQTIENLKAGIRGETTASFKYAAFASKAREEGKETVAKLFDAASKSESIHAANHKKVLDQLKGTIPDFAPEAQPATTAENLKSAFEGENYEVTVMYPGFINVAKTEGVQKAQKSFTWAMDTEKKHRDFYRKAMDAVNSGSENSLPSGYAVCPVCGNTYDASVIDAKCAFCQTPKQKFISI